MSRATTLGNGTMLVGLDLRGQVRDLYYPHVGLDNHVSGNHVHRIGVWIDGEMSWFDSSEWRITVESDPASSVGCVTAVHDRFGLEITSKDIVYNEGNIFIREFSITNTKGQKRDIKFFLGHEFQISESHRGDTGYYDPRFHAIVHYKGRRAFLISAESHGKPFDEYSVGIFEIEGRAGTYKDAEDGALTKNPIEHGRVDSVIGFSLSLPKEGSTTVSYWLTAGKSIEEVGELHEYVVRRTPKYLLGTSSDFWRAWVMRQQFNFYNLDQNIIDVFQQSLFFIRAHTDKDGSILASSDSEMLQHGRDTYSYMWPRDGAFSSMALSHSGDVESARRFFEFINNVITEDGYLMHKYRPDGSLGSSWHPWVYDDQQELPIQEDETAIILIALWEFYTITRDVEFIERVYNSLIKKAADFILAYMYEDGLPYPSYDLWEEKYGISTFTCSTKYGALFAAARFAKLLGKRDQESKYLQGAEHVHKAIMKHLYNGERKMFYKLVRRQKDGTIVPDPVLDMSSIYGVYRFGVLPVTDRRVVSAMKTIEKELVLGDGTIGGVPRYEEDAYYRTGDMSPPNPWIITTLWLAKYYIYKAKKPSDFDRVRELLSWATEHALASGAFPEQLDPHTGSPLSATPLTWSHSEFVTTVIEYLNKLEELGICKAHHPIT